MIKVKKVAMTTAERQRKYMNKPGNKEKHKERMRIYNEKMKRARELLKENGGW